LVIQIDDLDNTIAHTRSIIINGGLVTAAEVDLMLERQTKRTCLNQELIKLRSGKF